MIFFSIPFFPTFLRTEVLAILLTWDHLYFLTAVFTHLLYFWLIHRIVRTLHEYSAAFPRASLSFSRCVFPIFTSADQTDLLDAGMIIWSVLN